MRILDRQNSRHICGYVSPHTYSNTHHRKPVRDHQPPPTKSTKATNKAKAQTMYFATCFISLLFDSPPPCITIRYFFIVFIKFQKITNTHIQKITRFHVHLFIIYLIQNTIEENHHIES